MHNGLDLFINGVQLQPDAKITIDEKFSYFNGAMHYAKSALKLKIDIHNNSNVVYDSALKVGIVTKYNFDHNSDKDDKRVIRLNENDYLHLSPDFSRLFPSSWESYEVTLLSDIKQDLREKEISFTITLFTELGIKDFPIKVIFHQLPMEGF